MTKQDLLIQLRKQQRNDDTEAAHSIADDLLLDYIDDVDISAAYRMIDKWYA